MHWLKKTLVLSIKRQRMLSDSIRGQWLRFLCCTVTASLMSPSVHLQSALVYDFLCSLTVRTSWNGFHMLEHGILDNLNLCSEATVAQIWFQNKLSLIPLEVWAVLFVLQVPWVASWGHVVTLVFSFLKPADYFIEQTHHSAFPPGTCKGCIFSTSLPTYFIIHLLDYSCSRGCGIVISHGILVTSWSWACEKIPSV